MKKPILCLLALSAGLSLASAFDGSIFGFADAAASRQRPAAQEGEEQDSSSPQALCRQVQVQLDEGYGVSSQETRVICQDNP